MAEWNSKANDVFLRAAEIESPAERRLFLDHQCGDNAGLRAQVESLLAASEKVGSFLNKPAVQAPPGGRETVDYEPITEGPGTIIGPYKLMEQIGAGGMGLVFVAEQQQPVRRKVALKIIKPGMDTREVTARFEAERQALALMDHPNIARIFDGGATESGRPYFVMELVKGISIIDYCDQQQRTARERLELFLSVCQAVQHAHAKGVIHRDLKPSNVLVAPHDGVPVVKVIDFGVAKAIGSPLTDKTIYTRFAQMIGTPLYMAPEQAEVNALDVDIRSDVYSLGVLLYELLTGTTPFDRQRFATAAYDEIRRIIKEEEPPKPSTRLSTLGESLSLVSAQRKTEPAKLSALVKGDLDWIVMKALEKDRARRYETAGAFAADVRRFLSEEPIEARPPSAWYRFRKLARRNKVALTTAALVGLSLVAGTAVSAWQAVRATSAERLVASERDEAAGQRDAAVEAEKQAAGQRDEARAARQDLRRALYSAEMNMVQGAWESDNLLLFDQLLQKQRPGPDQDDPRGFEWHLWNRLRHAERRSVALAGGFVRWQDPAFSPDGTRFAGLTAVGKRLEVRVWDTATGQVRHTLAAFDGLLTQDPSPRLVFSADGRRVALTWLEHRHPAPPGDEVHHQLRVWEADSGRELFSHRVGQWINRSLGLALSPTGQFVACATSSPGDLRDDVEIWDVDTGKRLLTTGPRGTVKALAFSLDARRLAVARGRFSDQLKNEVQILEVKSGKTLLAIGNDDKLVPEGVAFSHDGAHLAALWGVWPGPGILSLHDAATGQELHRCPGVTGWQLVFCADDRQLTCSADGSRVRVWDVATGAARLTVRGHLATPAVGFTQDGQRLVTAGWDGTVKEWDTVTPRLTVPASQPEAGERCAHAYAFHRGALRLAWAYPNNHGGHGAPLTVRAWDGETGKDLFAPKRIDYVRSVWEIVWSPDGSRLAAGYELSDQGLPTVLTVWDADSGRELLARESKRSPIQGAAFSPDGRRLAWGEHDGLHVWDGVTTRDLREDIPPGVTSLAFSPDGMQLAETTFRGIQVWDVAAARVSLTLGESAFYGPLAYSRDGTRLAACVRPNYWERALGVVKVWDATTGAELLSLKGDAGARSVAFSQDGRRIASLGWRRQPDSVRHDEVTVWDAGTGLPLLRLDATAGLGQGELRFHPDGTRLFLFNRRPSGPSPTRVYRQVWDATPLP